MDSALSKKPIFGDQDDGLVSIADVATKPMYHSVFQSRGSLRSFSLSSSSSVSVRCFDEQLPRQPHFLENCFLCKKHIGGNNDIYMYRGDTPFCSEECRLEQIETDEAKENEKKWAKSMRKNQKKSNSSSSNNKSQGYPFRTGTVAAA